MTTGKAMKIVLITGTSSGIGLATALRLARAGDRVYASMRDLHRAETLRQTASAERLPIQLVELDVERRGVDHHGAARHR